MKLSINRDRGQDASAFPFRLSYRYVIKSDHMVSGIRNAAMLSPRQRVDHAVNTNANIVEGTLYDIAKRHGVVS